jgi:hydrogenase-4 component F
MELIFIAGFFVAALIGYFTRRIIVIETLTVAASVIAFIGSTIVAIAVSKNGSYNPSSFFRVDSLGAIVMMIIATVGLAATVYSIAYLRSELKKKIIDLIQTRLYLLLLNLFLAAMFLAISSNSPIFTWVCIEGTTLSTALLISFYNKPSAMEAAWKYLIINSIGLLLGFFGTLLYFTVSHSVSLNAFLTWQSLIANASHIDPAMVKIAFVFILIGYGTKAGLAPMHTWLPDAHSKAPSPVSALLSGVLLNVAFYVVLRFKIVTDAVAGTTFSSNLLITFGIISVVFAAIIIVNQQHYKRMMAYSSIENMGIIALGFGFGGIGALAAVMHMIYHALVKSSLFFLSGNLMLKYSTGHINMVKGVLKAMPYTGLLLIAGALAITGMPPFGIFFSEFFTFTAGINKYPFVVIAAILAIAVLFIGFLRNISSMLLGDKPSDITKGEKNIWLVIPPATLICMVLIMSFYLPPFIQTLIHNASGLL